MQEIAERRAADARNSAKQLVALQQRLESLNDAAVASQRIALDRKTAVAAAIQRNAADTARKLQKQNLNKQIIISNGWDAKVNIL